MNIDWAYLRKGWTSCKKAQEFLEEKKSTITEVVDARKVKIPADKAWDQLKNGSTISVAKGKKILKFDVATADKDDILKRVMGPSGNLRAPTYRVGDTFVVGFNLDLYEEWLGWVVVCPWLSCGRMSHSKKYSFCRISLASCHQKNLLHLKLSNNRIILFSIIFPQQILDQIQLSRKKWVKWPNVLIFINKM